MNPWIAFSVVIGIQFCVFLIIAFLEKKSLKSVLRILCQSLLLGLVFGIPFDLAIGKYLFLYTYVQGFTLLFLIANGIFSWGLFAATVMLLSEKRLLTFCMYVAIVCIAYEITNYIFPVYHWTISVFPVLEMLIVLVGYFGLALLCAIIESTIVKSHFRCLEWKRSKN